jgi:hypothetical protein
VRFHLRKRRQQFNHRSIAAHTAIAKTHIFGGSKSTTHHTPTATQFSAARIKTTFRRGCHRVSLASIDISQLKPVQHSQLSSAGK